MECLWGDSNIAAYTLQVPIQLQSSTVVVNCDQCLLLTHSMVFTTFRSVRQAFRNLSATNTYGIAIEAQTLTVSEAVLFWWAEF